MTRAVVSSRQESALRAALSATDESLVWREGRYWTSFFGGRSFGAGTIEALIVRGLLYRAGENLVRLTDTGREVARSSFKEASREAARRRHIAEARLSVGSRIARERGARAPQRLPYRDD